MPLPPSLTALADTDPITAENQRRAKKMSPRQYWNLPGSDDDPRFQVDYGGIWNPGLTKDRGVLAERARQRTEMYNTAEDDSIANIQDVGQRIQAEMNKGFNRRGQHMSNGGWGEWLEAVKEGEEGGRQVKVDGSGLALPEDTSKGTVPLSMQGLEGAGYQYDAFGAPVGVVQGKKRLTKQEQEAQRKAAQPKPFSLG